MQRVDGKPTLIYDNLKRRRYGRRLPITEETARGIEAWEKKLSGIMCGRARNPHQLPMRSITCLALEYVIGLPA
ncbi:hypothetical protein [Streptomyces sp. NPDC056387]|uniref:hypothetical protein n=1 Tax=Streptomyces sp. NPDC056387 TaxID=3345803 RepID=UPI0035DEB2B1